ncbi:2-oxoglutarate and iron-dependent oxygenase domain-containing protein [Curvibacter sp. HBC61]|uniref:2-oxoglutarate-dependent ethylene/succinate-forming enzyme n=1 Tax=Curvibacter cyanobacteriorum TaxID=3026422 RepID=A0ABT5MW89_9BURK|nr:2-oxoglutarate and iron-dependent oxygenase domain-containing protein [Curvibacter sp. HBC61]MDD0838321.1 2-oxoglutarate and iron-dependent oxygenase domain-containing protein [Curvibacter sp. HBC61]
MPDAQLPLLDLHDALTPGSPRSAEVARQFRAAAQDSGFFYVRGHGVPQALIDAQFALAEQLLTLPAAVREALSIRHSPASRGFEALGAQTLDASAHPDLKESFYCGLAYPDDHPYVRAGYQTYGHNQWPAELPEAPARCEAYQQAMLTLAQRLMQLMALSLDLPEHYFDAANGSPMVTLRMVRYPPHPPGADEHTFGAGAHTDWGALTLLAQDHHGGLEVCTPRGDWIEATPLPGTLVVNLGDMVPRWTNGRYHSNPHRVRNRHSGGAARYSIPFFYEPDYLAPITPVPGTVAPGETPRFEPCTAGEHLRQMYLKTYAPKAAVAAHPVAERPTVTP